MKLSTLFSLVAMTATLAACGGGGGSTAANPNPPVTADVVDKYVGTWVACYPNAAGTRSSKDTIVITKSSATSMVVDAKGDDFANASCTGTPAGTPFTSKDRDDFKGTKIIGTDTVDKFEETDLQGTVPVYKQIYLIKGNKLIYGAGFAAKDADGYPVALDPEIYALTKQ
jgi:hypothetical protein